MSDTRIQDGIEWYSVDSHDGEEDCQCARCGSSCTYVRCDYCGGDGFRWGDEVDSEWYEDDDQIPCPACDETGGSWHCISDPEWCEAHPLPGREQIKSTALNSQAWRDML